MTTDAELAQLVGRHPDPRLLGDEVQQLPADVGRPAPIPPDPRRAPVVAVGATMTGVTLLGGLALLVAGAVVVIGSGWNGFGLVALVLGLLLVSTHWGWVHVAEITANSLEGSRNRQLIGDREAWLQRVEPYARWVVETSVRDDGSIVIERTCHRPVPLGEDRFSFVTEVEAREQHSGDEPGAQVAERAELMRRQAAADTERERIRYEAASEAFRLAQFDHDDEQQRLAAVRAASQALSEQINTNLREPPLAE
jgi:hypothetical protein